ncbi:MAG: PAS domain S-box protein [bacterium]
MVEQSLAILHLEDNPDDAALIQRAIKKEGIASTIERVATRADYIAALDKGSVNIILLDYSLPDFDGFSALALAREKLPDIPVILVTGSIGEELAAESIKQGAYDYVFKDRLSRLVPAIHRAIQDAASRKLQKRTQDALQASEERYRLLLESSSDSIYVLDYQWRIMVINTTAEHLVQIPRGKLIGNKLTDLFPSFEKTEFYKTFQRVMESRKSDAITAEYTYADGRKSWYEVHVDPVPEGIVCIARDITERKYAEEKYTTILRTALDGFCAVDLQGHILDVNDAYCRLIGYSREELLRMRISDIEIVENPEETTHRLQRIMEAGGDRFETQHRCKDGRIIDVDVSTNYLKKEQQFFVFLRDITARKQMETTLRESEERHRLLIEQSVMGIGVSQGNQIVFANPALLRIFEYDTLEDFVKTPLLELVAPSSREMIAKRLKKVAQGEPQPSDFEYDIVCKNGKIKTLHAQSSWVTLGDVKYTQTTFEDITERKRAEEALRDSETKYRSLFDNSLDAVMLTAPDGSILAANPAACKMFERPEEEICRLGRTSIIDSSDPRLALAIEERASKGMFSGELTGLRKDGTKFPIELTSILFKDNKGNLRTSMIIRDITNRKQMEERLIASEQKYRDLIDTAQAGVYQTHLNGTILFANKTLVDIFEFPSIQDAIGTNIIERYKNPADRKRLLLELNKNHAINNYEITFITKTNKEIVVLLSAMLIGETISGMVQDITSLKKAQDQIRLFSDAVQSVNDCVGITDLETNFLFINTAFEKTYGVSSQEIIGKKIDQLWDYFNPQHKKRTIIPHTFQDGGWQGEVLHKRKDGSFFPAWLSTAIIKNSNNQPIGLIGITRDITEQKKAEEILRQSEERYRGLFENSIMGIVQVHPDGHLLTANSTFARMFGFASPEQMIAEINDVGKQLYANPEERKQVLKLLAEKGRIKPREEEALRRDGTIFSVWASMRAIKDSNGKTLYNEAEILDITERKRAEKLTQTFTELSLELTKADTLNSLAKPVAKAVDTLLNYDAFLFVQRLPDSEMFHIVYAEDIVGGKQQRINTDDVEQEMYRPLGKLLEGEPFILNRHPQDNPQNWQRFGDESRPSSSLLFAPICFGNQVCGILSAQSYTPQRYQQPDLALLKSIADTMAPALRRVQAENILQKSESSLKEAQRIGRIGSWQWDIITNKAQWSEETYRIFGLRYGELIEHREKFLKMIHPEDRHRVDQALADAVNGVKEYSVDYRIILSNGTIKVIHAQAEVQRDNQGKAIFLHGTVQDITDRIRTEEELRISEQKFSKTFHSSPDAVALSELESGLLLEVNEGFKDVFGYSREEAIGHTTIELGIYHRPTDRTKIIQTVRKQGNLHNYELKGHRKSGSELVALLSIEQIEIGGKPCIITIARDITERKRAEENIRLSYDRLNLATKAGHLGIWDWDILKNELHWDDRMYALYGLKPSQLKGNYKTWLANVHPDDRKRCDKISRQALLGKQNYDIEFRVVWPDGSLHVLKAYAQIIRDNAGNALRMTGVNFDITDRKQAEETLRVSREKLRNLAIHLESIREEERTRIAREIHDELGQTLTALKMDTSWLTKRFTKEQTLLSQKTKDMDVIIDRTIKTVKRITSELRPGLLDDLGLPAALDWQANEFTRHSGIPSKVTIIPAGITLNRETTTGLFRIFQETLTNIARHAHATRVTVSLVKKRTRIVLTIKDNGKGITQKQINSIQSLGLIGIRERVGYLEGTVEFKGIKGKGTTVIVQIPIK